MVVSERPIVEVVLVVEGTANLSLYAETLKNNYIVPSLECLSGGPPDDHDYGVNNNVNCSLYGMVVFQTAESAPDTASICHGPASSTHKLLQWFDRIKFVGGGASNCSHITEGIATALHCFDDFDSLRETSSTSAPNRTIPKHCILVCNSPPYGLPCSESLTYAGWTLDRLVSTMGERGINLSVFAPAMLPFLFKLYEKAGGDLTAALSKNYAKDRRHLILLRAFSLQEIPLSPQHNTTAKSIESNIKATSSPSPSNHGQKRPLSPASSVSSTTYAEQQIPQQIQQQQQNYFPTQPQHHLIANGQPQTMGQYPGNRNNPQQVQAQQIQQQPIPHQQQPMQNTRSPLPPTFVQPNKAPTPDTILKPRGNSPIYIEKTTLMPQNHPQPNPTGVARMPWSNQGPQSNTTPPVNSASPSPNPMPMLTSQLQMPSVRGHGPPQGSAPQPNMPGQPPQARLNFTNQQIRGVHRPDGYNPVMVRRAASPFSAPPPPAASPLNQNSMNRASAPSSLSQNVPSPMSNVPPHQQNQPQPNIVGVTMSGVTMIQDGAQQHPQQGIQIHPNQQPQLMNQGPMTGPPQQQMHLQSQQHMAASGHLIKNKRCIWKGIIDYQEKSISQQVENAAQQKISYMLPCSITTQSPDLELYAEKWSEQLVLSLIPRSLIQSLSSVLKDQSHILNLHFDEQNNPEVCQKLARALTQNTRINSSVNFCGCVQFTNKDKSQPSMRVMIVVYTPEKKMFIGFIPQDQEGFFNKLKSIIDQHKNDQKKKQMPGATQVYSQNQQQPGMQQMHPGAQQAQFTGNSPGFYQIQQIPGGTITQVAAQQTIPAQNQMKAQPQTIQSSQPNQGQLTNQTFTTQALNGIRMTTTGPTLIAQNTGQILGANQGHRPQQQNVLLNQALGPVQRTAIPNHNIPNQAQILIGTSPGTATLVSQGQQQGSRIHFNSPNEYGPGVPGGPGGSGGPGHNIKTETQHQQFMQPNIQTQTQFKAQEPQQTLVRQQLQQHIQQQNARLQIQNQPGLRNLLNQNQGSVQLQAPQQIPAQRWSMQ
ncbi:mediator of RNA polymerase II transcription subunit 25-like isoform X3 [Brevipalpus obovatus]|uniref:mediator of RNA polymerase II transcription subunit 25-like isoform X3 n=1 Tax=Brevipalpus obovatus TaxID=246614 RepID=UPI003D9ED175